MYSDPLDLLRQVLKHWLDIADPCPTWEDVVTALRSPAVNEKCVAQQLESKYCTLVQSMREKSNNSLSPPTSHDVTESVASKCEGIPFNVPYCSILLQNKLLQQHLKK